MKTVIFTLCILLGLAFAGTVSADKKGGGKGGGKGAHASGGGKGGGGGMGQHAGGGTHQGHANGMHQGAQGNGHGQHGLNANHAGGHGLNAHNGLHGTHTGNALAHHGGNAQFAHNHFAGNHWHGTHWRASRAVFAGYHRAWHDRYWWHGHYDRVSFVGGPYWGGYWYWDGGYWFPAWGYEPAYVGYLYDGPIYAYSNLPPDQVVVNVQEILQDQGYYTGDVDGQLGTQTRDALASYQRDHDLEVTSAIDEPTVQSLGLNNEQA